MLRWPRDRYELVTISVEDIDHFTLTFAVDRSRARVQQNDELSDLLDRPQAPFHRDLPDALLQCLTMPTA